MVREIGLDELIRKHPFFEGFEDEALKFIAGCAANERFEDGTMIFQEGGPADKFYIIRHGRVKLECRCPGRDPVILQTLEDGEILGWSWLVPPYRWSWGARTIGLSRLVSFDAVCLRDKMDSDPRLGYEMHKRFVHIMQKRLSAARVQLLDLYGGRCA